MGDRLFSSAGTERTCTFPMRLPDPSPILDKNCVPMGPEFLSNTGGGLWRKVHTAFPDSNSVMDKIQSAINPISRNGLTRLLLYIGGWCEFGGAQGYHQCKWPTTRTPALSPTSKPGNLFNLACSRDNLTACIPYNAVIL